MMFQMWREPETGGKSEGSKLKVIISMLNAKAYYMRHAVAACGTRSQNAVTVLKVNITML